MDTYVISKGEKKCSSFLFISNRYIDRHTCFKKTTTKSSQIIIWMASCVSKVQIHIKSQKSKSISCYIIHYIKINRFFFSLSTVTTLVKTLPFQNRLGYSCEIKPQLCRNEYSIIFDSLYDDSGNLIFPKTHHGAPLCSVSTRISGFFLRIHSFYTGVRVRCYVP